MKNDLSRDDINLIIAQARQQRSAAAGDLMITGYHILATWIANQTNRLAHAIPVLPTKAH
jgi:hypothetical protein